MKSMPNPRATSIAHDGIHAAAQLAQEDAEASSCQIDWQARRIEMRKDGIARGRAHNQELHELGHIRRHGGYQRDLPF